MKRVGRILDAIQTALSSVTIASSSEEHQSCDEVSTHKTPRLSIIPKLGSTDPSPQEIISLADIEATNDPCNACPNPCSTHATYPSYLRIDHTSPLEGTVKPYFKHVIISTGKSDWANHIEDESNSLAAHLHGIIKEKDKKSKDGTNKPRIVITNSSRSNSGNVSFSHGNDVILFPDNILVRQLLPKHAAEFHEKFLFYLSSAQVEVPPNQGLLSFNIEPLPYNAVILICSHRRRDKRCGATAPLLKTEFEAVLKGRGLDPETRPNGVAVFMTSHIGGHKFAGNVIVYRDGQGIWYGRVSPCHAKLIVEMTVIEGKIIKDLYRGSMIGSFEEGKGAKLEW